MKHLFTMFIILFSTQLTWANWPVSTDPEPRNVVLEEFTGINCGYCPEGHQIAQGIKDSNPGRVVLINIHTGNFADPDGDPDHPDFRTPWGDALRALANVRGYPAGQINRQLFEGDEYYPQSEGALALSRDGWEPASNDILNDGNSPVNIGAKVERISYNMLEISVELYYTDDPGQNNLLNVALLESGYIGYQGGPSGSEEYVHDHILRDLVTGQWGVPIENIETGSKIERSFTYEITDRVNPIGTDLQLAVFVIQENHKHIYTGIEIEIPTIEPNVAISSNAPSIRTMVKNNTVEKTITLENISDTEITLDLSLTNISEIPSGWTYGFKEDGISPLTLGAGESKEIVYQITSNDKPGKLDVFLTAQETSTELKLPYYDEFKCISSDAEYYLVALEDAQQYSVADYIYNGGYEEFLEVNPDEIQAIEPNLSAVRTVVYDCGVEYELTDPDFNVIYYLMKDDVNIMIMGNRIIGALNAINGLDYFGTEYNGYNIEGSGNAPYTVWLSGVPGDPITKNLSTNIEGNLINYFISLFNITDETTTTPIMHFANDGRRVIYNNSTMKKDTFNIKASEAIFGVKVDNGSSKHVLLGVTPYVIANESDREMLMRYALNWIHGVADIEEEPLKSESIRIWPNPVKNQANISFDISGALVEPVSIKLINSTGETVLEMPVEYLNEGEYTKSINVENLPTGSYNLIISIRDIIHSQKMVIIR